MSSAVFLNGALQVKAPTHQSTETYNREESGPASSPSKR